MARSRSSITTLEKRIRNRERSDALLRGQISYLQVKWQRSEEAATKYKCRLEKLKRGKEALDAENKDLKHQLEEAQS